MSIAIKERPILFSGSMVRAILEGRKTQTRRVIKGKGTWSVEEADDFSSRKWPGYEDKYGTWTDMECPYGYATDRLWVREAFSAELGQALYPPQSFAYKASWCNGEVTGWKPSIHMPRKASRIILEITGVRVERLNEISEEDATSEGVVFGTGNPGECRTCAKGAFMDLWNSINGVDSWLQNPWVWVVEFKRLKQCERG